MFGLGNADSILVTSWNGSSVPSRTLIDGGNVGDGEKILNKLAALKVTRIDHLVCSHPHDDHAGGLLAILGNKNIKIGGLWMHLPWNHIDYARLSESLARANQTKIAGIVTASLKTQQEMVGEANARGIPIFEPFQGTKIGPLFVCGPSSAFYEDLLKDFEDLEKLNAFQTALAEYDAKVEARDLAAKLFDSTGEDDGELGAGPTDPENESSLILYAAHGAQKLLFTGDAGVKALTAATAAYDLRNLDWMQIPHHGSRRNLNMELVDLFRPKIAFVSAVGSTKHPRRKVVNASKAVKSTVYSTHHPSCTDLHHWYGNVPARAGYKPATPL